MQHVQTENVFVLHSRKYNDTKILLDVLSENYGLVSGVYRKYKNSREAIQFVEVSICWKGRSELKTFSEMECTRPSTMLQGEKLYCGFYLNELLLRVLPGNDPQTNIYPAYAQCLGELASSGSHETALRKFELTLLSVLGYGLDFFADTQGRPLSKSGDILYSFVPESGFDLLGTGTESPGSTARTEKSVAYSGEILQAISRGEFQQQSVRKFAKLLCRAALSPILGDKPLKSRELFTCRT